MPDDSESTPPTPPELQETIQRFTRLHALAENVAHSEIPISEQVSHLREIARELDLGPSNKDLERMIRSHTKAAAPLRGGDPIPLDTLHEAQGLWGDLLISGALNLVSAPPKVGKTALILHLAACVFRGDLECLGVPILDRFEHLIVVGTDMDRPQWFKLFFREGLAHKIDDKVILDNRITLWDSSSDVQLDDAGIALIREECQRHSNSLLLVDTLRSTTSSLGLDENRTEICAPVYALKMACASASVTTVVNHHTNKSVSGGSAITASAGSNALPGACDNTILMNWAKDCPDGQRRTDFRITISSSGRGKGGSLVAAITDDIEGGCWRGYGEADAIEASNRVRRVVQTLSGRQEDAYCYMLERWEGDYPTTSAQLAEFLQLRQTKKAWLVLNVLESKGLIAKHGEQPTSGRPAALWRPIKPDDEDLVPPLPPIPPSPGVYVRGEGNKVVRPAVGDRIELRNTGLVSRKGWQPNEWRGGYKVDRVWRDLDNGELMVAAGNTNARWNKDARPDASNEIKGIKEGKAVERSVDGTWQSGWVIADGTNPDLLKIAKLGNPMLTFSNLRWEVDVREATGSPFADPPPEADETPFVPF